MSEYNMLEWALKYADLGLAVFPVEPRGKKPLGNLAPNGLQNATTDKDKISKWWDRSPQANIGIATGSISNGIFVVDLDVKPEKGIDGRESLKDWEQEHGKIPDDTWTVKTGSGGTHIFYKESSIIGNRTNLLDGIDVRGEGGYVVAPPSVHQNGRRYEWEQAPGEVLLIEDSNIVTRLLLTEQEPDKKGFQLQDDIPEGQRVTSLMSLLASMQAKGASDEAIRSAIHTDNESRCNPPLSDKELEQQVFPALKRFEKGTAAYMIMNDFKQTQKKADLSNLDMISMDGVEEKTPEWLVTDYIPKYQITVMAGDGGSGKTTTWCEVGASVSSGKPCFMNQFIPDDWAECEPQKVLFFSSEDSFEYTLKGRLQKNGANLKNIFSISLKDERFKDIKFDSELLEALINKHRPGLVIFDPIQSFLPPNIQMGQRNAMRACLNPLIGLAEKYKTTFLIIVHANKQSGVSGRKRIADSADIWDIARSVLMVGTTLDQNIRYISQEKSNYGPLGDTVLFSINDGKVEFEAYSTKKDKDFITEYDATTHQKPQREEARKFIMDFLKDGKMPVKDMDDMAKASGISIGTLKRTKTEMKAEGVITIKGEGYGKEKVYYCSLMEQSPNTQ